MIKLKITTIILIFFSLPVFAQTVIETNWDILQAIDYIPKYNEELKGKVLFPKFPNRIINMDKKLVQLEGYIIPVDRTGATLVLSASPYAACYFCGKAGPASIMTVKLKIANKKYRTDNYKKFKGTLRLNYSDIHEFYYILDNAEQVQD